MIQFSELSSDIIQVQKEIKSIEWEIEDYRCNQSKLTKL